MAIDTKESLCRHLQTAIELEHSTLPPYLCALYSIVAGTNEDARCVIQSVALEEMLHLTLAANILNAVGGRPVLDAHTLLPPHPAKLPHSNGSVSLLLRPFSRETIKGFMDIERPTDAASSAQDEGYATIGQFYRAIDEALVRLSHELGDRELFSGDPQRQVTEALYYGGAGRIVAVSDLGSARRALREIVEQGEGLDHRSVFDGDRDMFHPDRDELGHYFRFEQLLIGRAFKRGDRPSTGPTGDPIAVDWSAVYPMRENPRRSDHSPGTAAREAMDAFNTSYCTVLQLLERTFNGVPTLLKFATGAMYGLKQQIIDLMAMNANGNEASVGPSFEWVPPEQRRFSGARISVIPAGPYLMRGEIQVFEALGKERLHGGVCVLCRCGGSRTKPFCDGTHARIGFTGEESASHDTMAERRKAYPAAGGATVYDDRTRCAHFGQCTDRCPAAFGVGEDDFVNPSAAPTDILAKVVAGCPSGALTFAPAGSETLEEHETPSVHPIIDGPYRLRGGIEVIGANGVPFEVRERQTLCRCGNSRNKPFCDGSHWYAGFKDPLPPELERADPFPWTVPGAAERGRERYAREQAAKAAAGGRPEKS